MHCNTAVHTLTPCGGVLKTRIYLEKMSLENDL